MDNPQELNDCIGDKFIFLIISPLNIHLLWKALFSTYL